MKKRIISSLLAAMFLVSTLVLGISAAEGNTLVACGPVGFKDSDQVTYTEAVAVTGGIGLFTGTTDGRFAPLSNVNRAQMAAIIVKMVKGSDFNADAYKGEGNPFSDTAAFEGGWAEGYINACAQMGIVKGYGDGTFQPANPVTAAEALTMVLNALKIDAGAGEWPATVMNKADQLKLADGLNAVPEADKVLNREQLAAIVYAGIQYKPDGGKALLSSVFGVDKITTEHKFGQTHCEICRTVKPGLLTRADLEQALVETAFAYHLKGTKMQYDSQELSAISAGYGGNFRYTPWVAPEYGTRDTSIFSVCSAYITQVYYNALNHHLLRSNPPSYPSTTRMWQLAENQLDQNISTEGADPITDLDVNACILRWKSSERSVTDSTSVKLGIDRSPYFANFGDYHLTFANGYYPTTPEEQEMADNAVQEFLADWDKNLRPGDIIVSMTHTYIYIGHGYMLDCSSRTGGKYDVKKGADKVEPNGSVYQLTTVKGRLLNPKETTQCPDEALKTDDFIILRPTNYMVTDDGDGILGNDLLANNTFALPAATASRLQYPAMEIDRTVNITTYGTAVQGDNLTYSVKITNRTNDKNYVKLNTAGSGAAPETDYAALPVVEYIPAGTEFVSATGDYNLDNGKLTWSLDIPAGQTAEVTFTVKVTAPVGAEVICEGGQVADIPSNSIRNRIGGKKLSAEAQAMLLQLAGSTDIKGTDLAYANAVYEKLGIPLNLPSVNEVAASLFAWGKVDVNPIASPSFYDPKDAVDMFTLRDNSEQESLRAMLIANYYGGYRFRSAEGRQNDVILEFKPDYYEPGDIVVHAIADETTGQIQSSQIMICAGQNEQGEIVLLTTNSDGQSAVYTGTEAQKLLAGALKSTNSLFFALRPTQAGELSK